MELSTLDYHYLLREWQLLAGGRVQKIYMKDRALVLQVYNRQNYTWFFDDGKSFITQSKLSFPQNPTGFTMFLRKRLQGYRLTHVALHGFDRIVVITVQTREGPLQLIIELLGKVNYLLCKEGNIVSAFETHKYTDRSVRGGVPYVPPPSRPAPWEADTSVIIGKEAAKAVATEIGLGGKYSEEVCARAGVDRKQVVGADEEKRIAQQLQLLKDHVLKPMHNTSEALPFEFVTKQGHYETTTSYNEAIDSVERVSFDSADTKEQAHTIKERQTKQQKIISAQKTQLETLTKTIEENQRKGELIYENYTELQALLAQLKIDWKEMPFAKLQEKYKDHPIIRSLGKDGTIEIEL